MPHEKVRNAWHRFQPLYALGKGGLPLVPGDSLVHTLKLWGPKQGFLLNSVASIYASKTDTNQNQESQACPDKQNPQ